MLTNFRYESGPLISSISGLWLDSARPMLRWSFAVKQMPKELLPPFTQTALDWPMRSKWPRRGNGLLEHNVSYPMKLSKSLTSKKLEIELSKASLTRLDPEPYNQYNVKYIGNCTVSRPTGIDIVRDAIGKLVTIHSENQWVEGVALISATTVSAFEFC